MPSRELDHVASMTGKLGMLIAFIYSVEIVFKDLVLPPRKMLFTRFSLKTSSTPSAP